MSAEHRTATFLLDAGAYLDCITFNPKGDISKIDMQQWAVLEDLRTTLGFSIPVEVAKITNSTGISSWFWWECSTLIGERNTRLLACDLAERCLPIYESLCPHDPVPRKLIQLARDFARGFVTREALGHAGEECIQTSRKKAETASKAAANAVDAAISTAEESADATVYYGQFFSSRAIYGHSFAGNPVENEIGLVFSKEYAWQIDRLCAYVTGEAS